MGDLLAALLFPGTRHERGTDPGPFSDYRFYKPHLKNEFRRMCVYCRLADGLKGDEAFGVDHYLPKSKFPGLACAWSNLFYACNVCNTWKGETVSTPELFLPNPCEHQMADHLQYRGAEVETYTPHGEWLSELLHLKARLGLREFILSALGEFLKTRTELLNDLITYERRLDESQRSEEHVGLHMALRATTAELQRVDLHIERLIGGPIGAS